MSRVSPKTYPIDSISGQAIAQSLTDFRMLFMNSTTHSIRSISSSVILLLAISAHAATVWDGPTISFTKANYANPLLAENQDRLTANVWITRGSAQGLFNANTESGFTHFVSPAGTEWANGSLENYATLSYTNWNHWATGVNPNPYATVGVQAVLHLIPDDIYLSVRFTSWSRRRTWRRSLLWWRFLLSPLDASARAHQHAAGGHLAAASQQRCLPTRVRH